jgi:hypothetical protein
MGMALLGVAVLLIGCSEPGVDGTSYVAIDWEATPQAISFPSFPSTVYAGEYVQHSAGNHQGEYLDYYGYYWESNYSVTVDEGTEGTLFSDGEDGSDMYFTLWLNTSGPTMYQDQSALPESEVEGTIEQLGDAGTIGPPAGTVVTEVHTETKTQGNITITATFRKWDYAD